MSPTTVGSIGICILLLLLMMRMHIGLVMILVGFLGYMYLTSINGAMGILSTAPRGSTASFALTVIPLFIFMGQLAYYSGLSKDLYYSGHKLIGHIPGGLSMATIAACAAFAAICGSSLATAVTMSSVALPSMKKYGYDNSLATGSIAVGGTLGLLIPPSVALVLYGFLTEQSIGKLFIAGILPGLLLSFLFIVSIFLITKLNPRVAPTVPRSSIKEMLVSSKGLVIPLSLFLVVMGGIYTGLFTPTEAAAIGTFIIFMIGIISRRLNGQDIFASLKDTGKTSAMIFIIMIGASIFGSFLGISRIPYKLAGFVHTLELSPYIILSIVVLGYIILGCMMEGVGITLLTIPIIYPVIVALGFDPIWFGIIFTVSMEMGMITPPVGMNVFAISGMAKDVPMVDIFKGTLWFIPAIIICIIILTIFPQIVMVLPNQMG